MSKVIELLSKYLLLPLIEKGWKFLFNWAQNWLEERKRKKEDEEQAQQNRQIAEDYENSSTDDSGDHFDRMP